MFARLSGALLVLGLATAAPAWGQLPTPEEHLGFRPGTDRRLANWDELLAYYDRIAGASNRVAIDTLGPSTGGRPFVMLTITSPENHARLEELRQIHLQLADPRRISGDEQLARIREEARTIVLITSAIHSTEVGAGQMPANLLHRLATATEDDIQEVLDRTIILLIPSLNPDGTQLVSEWYREYVGTEFEGVPPVELYHQYVGHDNNRDWYALTQQETRLVVEKAHNAWRPMIVHDIHQMGQNGARMFVPPYTEPAEPNIDPLLVAAINQAGSYMAAELTAQGKRGVVTSAQYDLFSPSRSYSHYHGGVRILSETASAQLASPIDLRPADLISGRGFNVRERSMNFPAPWEGGIWTLANIVDYQESAAIALLKNAARNRDFWVDTFFEVGQRAVEGWDEWPDYWLLPDRQQNPTGLGALLRILTVGGVEVHRTVEARMIGSETVPAGSYVIPMRQPYAAWAQALLEPQEYPLLRETPNGPPVAPYDVTAHTLPLLMGVRAFNVRGGEVPPLTSPIDEVEVVYEAPPRLRGAGAPRIGLYRGWQETMAAGWTRWLFDQHGIEYTSLSDEDLRKGNLDRRFDVIIFQDQPEGQITGGWSRREMPVEYTGGIGGAGLSAIRDFVLRGGRLVAIESATDLPINLFNLEVQDPLWRFGPNTFFIPGSIVSLQVEPQHSRTWGDGGGIAWFWRSSLAFQPRGDGIRVIARYGEGNPGLSGLVIGGERLAGLPAIVEADVGRGSIVLFGFQPNYRGQSIATWPLLFEAIAPSN